MSGAQAFRLIAGIAAAIAFVVAGAEMTSLESEAGNTVAEAFDNAMGVFSYGMAALSIALAMPATTAAAQSPVLSRAGSAGQVPVAGWDPAGERVCPSCGKQVEANRTTHCNHCGHQLVTTSRDEGT